MDKNTKLIVEACRQVIQSAEDYENETQTTPITVVQACEQLNCVIERVKRTNKLKSAAKNAKFRPMGLPSKREIEDYVESWSD